MSNINSPMNDGITHINIYSKGKTELGQLLGHYAHTPFIHPHFGPFASMEGLWYYLRAVKKDEKLRELHGHEAKFYGKRLESKWIKNFNTLIIDANYHKVTQSPLIKKLMMESSLPFDHYYIKEGDGSKHMQIRLSGFDWLIDGFESIRSALKGNSEQGWEVLDYVELLKQE